MDKNMSEKKKGWFKRLISGSDETEYSEETTAETEPDNDTEDTIETSVAEETPIPADDAPEVEIMDSADASEDDTFATETIDDEDVNVDAEDVNVIDTSGVEIAENEVEEHDFAIEVPEKKRGLFRRFRDRLGKTRSSLVGRVRDVIAMAGAVDEEMLEDVEAVLIQADVGIETTMKIVDQMRSALDAKKAATSEDLVVVFQEALEAIVAHDERRLELTPGAKPTIMLVVGVNGTGKTTTIGKLAKQYRDEGKQVCLVAADTFRAAAVEQLTIWADKTGSKISKKEMGSDPAAVCYEALSTPDIGDYDVVLIDTAGRLHTKTNLMEELSKIKRVIAKIFPEAPHETLLVLDATTGQNAMSQAKTFTEAVDVTGFIMTKLDGTAKGGILVALRDTFDVPVLKIGIGEGEEDLRDFDPETFVAALFAD